MHGKVEGHIEIDHASIHGMINSIKINIPHTRCDDAQVV